MPVVTGQPDETRSETLSVDDARELARAHWEGGECDGCHISYVLALLADRDRLQQENERLRELLGTSSRVSVAAISRTIEDFERARAAVAEVARLESVIDSAIVNLRNWGNQITAEAVRGGSIRALWVAERISESIESLGGSTVLGVLMDASAAVPGDQASGKSPG